MKRLQLLALLVGLVLAGLPNVAEAQIFGASGAITINADTSNFAAHADSANFATDALQAETAGVADSSEVSATAHNALQVAGQAIDSLTVANDTLSIWIGGDEFIIPKREEE